MRKKKAISVSKVSNKIPVINFYDNGIFEVSKGFYTEMFVIEQSRIQDAEIFKHKMNQLYLEMPKDCMYQMVVHNALIEREDYLRSVLVSQDKISQAAVYNKTILETVDIGCNNVQKQVYLVVGYKTTSMEKALNYFDEQESVIKKAFQDIRIRNLSSLERLEVIYRIFHPKRNDFRRILDLRNDGNIQLSNLKYLKMTEKDLVAPKEWDTAQKLVNHTILDKNMETQSYSRTLFLNCIPKEVSINVISDLTSVSSNMLFSIYYDQVDATLGYDEALELVKKNMIITKKQKRETIQDKKNRSTITFTERKETTEAIYLSEAALETTKNIVASDGVFMEVSVVITLFADSLEELNRNTDMLRISAAKFACSVKVLDMFQYEGFCSALPLCKQKVYVSRFLSGERLAQISPISAIEGNKRGGAFCGLNAINDNLIFYNRKHGIVLSGIISGMEHSGKTYQMKREILNAMLTTQDKINVITFGKEYDSYIDSLGGSRTYLTEINPFKMIEGYGLTIPEKEAKVLFIKAFCGNEKEAKLLLKESVDFNSYDSVLQIVNEGKYPQLTAILSAIDINIARLNSKSNRLSLYQVSNKIELLVTMEYLWNKSVEEKKNNSSNWIFIDGIDCLLEKEETIPYLLNYMKNTSSIRNVTTAVIQDTIGVMARSISSSIALEELVTDCGYIKLLNCGPLERKKFTELLNIPNALIPYITNVEPSQGLIVTPASNIAFNDNFLDKGNEFTELFKK